MDIFKDGKQMVNSDTANKMIKQLYAEEETILNAEKNGKTYSYTFNETPEVPDYDFNDTQAKLHEIRGKIAHLKHAINTFNITTYITIYGKDDLTVDQALFQMSVLNSEKKRLYSLLQIPEKQRSRGFNSKEADFTQRNFDIADVRKEYDRVCKELMDIQQAINSANLMHYFKI